MEQKIEMCKGDTRRFIVTLKCNGEPFVPTEEKVVFAVGYGHDSPPLFTSPVIDNMVRITHDQTKNLPAGIYCYDLRVYTEDKEFVATPVVDEFVLLGVANNDI